MVILAAQAQGTNTVGWVALALLPLLLVLAYEAVDVVSCGAIGQGPVALMLSLASSDC